MIVTIKTEEEMIQDETILFDDDEFYSREDMDATFTDVMFELFGQTLEVDVDPVFGSMTTAEGYTISQWMLNDTV